MNQNHLDQTPVSENGSIRNLLFPMERMIYIHTDMDGVITCNCIYPSWKLEILQGKDFEILQNDPEYIALCDRVKVLIKTRTK